MRQQDDPVGADHLIRTDSAGFSSHEGHVETGRWHCPFSTWRSSESSKLLQLLRSEKCELAVEVVMLRHEVAVLCRQVTRPALRPSGRALLAGLSRRLGRQRLGRFFVKPSPAPLASDHPLSSHICNFPTTTLNPAAEGRIDAEGF